MRCLIPATLDALTLGGGVVITLPEDDVACVALTPEVEAHLWTSDRVLDTGWRKEISPAFFNEPLN